MTTETPIRRIGPRNVHMRCRDGEPGHPIDRCRVVTFLGNYSAFNGYHWQASDYSAVVCTACGTNWRTNAAYVHMLPRERGA